jgi:hypothetical protein
MWLLATPLAWPARGLSIGGPADQPFVPGSYTSTVVSGAQTPVLRPPIA